MIAGLLIAGAILLKGNSQQNTAATIANPATGADLFANAQIRPVTTNDHIIGSLNAKVVIVEYSDTECPFCKVFQNTLQQVVQKYGNSVAWVYRHYPIAELHSKAPNEADATECAWEQGGNDMFWKYTNEVFATTNSNNSLDPAELPKIAGDLGLNVAQFNTCLSSGKYTSKVQADVDEGQKLGIDGTPTSLILVNGKVVDSILGAEPIDQVESKIDALLK